MNAHLVVVGFDFNKLHKSCHMVIKPLKLEGAHWSLLLALVFILILIATLIDLHVLALPSLPVLSALLPRILWATISRIATISLRPSLASLSSVSSSSGRSVTVPISLWLRGKLAVVIVAIFIAVVCLGLLSLFTVILLI